MTNTAVRAVAICTLRFALEGTATVAHETSFACNPARLAAQDALLIYQHDGVHKYDRPDLVPADTWHMRSEHTSKTPKAAESVRAYFS